MRVLRGLTFMSMFFFSAVTLTVLLSPCMFLVFFHSKRVIKWRRAYGDYFSGMFIDFLAGMLMSGLGDTKIFVYAEQKDRCYKDDRGSLIICTSSSEECYDQMFSMFRGLFPYIVLLASVQCGGG